MQRTSTGFTLIELMIVIAILGILLAIAIPAYSDYSARAKVSEGMMIASDAKMSVSEYRLSQGAFPSNSELVGLPATVQSPYVDGMVVVADGVVEVTFRNIDPAVDGTILTLVPTFQSSAIRWTCTPGGAQPILSRFVPSSCR